jgi:lycopene cyclase domain-containing protein
VRHLLYLGLLAACLVGTLPLELVLRTRVYARWRRLSATLVPIVLVFGTWDLTAAAQHTWRYDHRYVVGLNLPAHLPIEELLFFVVIPTCAILTLEAVRACRPRWVIGDEREQRR